MSYCVGRVVKITLRSCIRMLSRSRECWRQVTAFVCPFSLSSMVSRIQTEGARPFPRRDAVTASLSLCVVVRMSQRHAFVAYNCSHYALFRFSSPYPSRFSVIVVAVGERLPVRDIFVPPIYTREKTVCTGARRCRSSGQRTHLEECRQGKRECCVRYIWRVVSIVTSFRLGTIS